MMSRPAVSARLSPASMRPPRFVRSAAGGDLDGVAAQASAQVLEIVGGEIKQRPPGNRAAVAQFAAAQGEALAGDQRTVGLQVARARQQVDLRGEDFPGAAVRQGHFLFDEPDNVAGQAGRSGPG